MIEFEGHRPIKGELISLAFNCLNYLPLGVQSRYAFNWIPIIGTFNLPHSLPLEDRSVRIPNFGMDHSMYYIVSSVRCFASTRLSSATRRTVSNGGLSIFFLPYQWTGWFCSFNASLIFRSTYQSPILWMPLSRTLNHLFLKASSSVFSKANSRSLSASVWGHSAKVMLIVELYHHDSERMLERLVQRLRRRWYWKAKKSHEKMERGHLRTCSISLGRTPVSNLY